MGDLFAEESKPKVPDQTAPLRLFYLHTLFPNLNTGNHLGT